MKSLKKLGKKFKEKYPEYSHLSNQEAGELVKLQFPDSYADYSDEPINYLPELQSIYSPDKGMLSSWWQGKKSASRSKLLDAINGEVGRLIQGLDQRIEYQKKEVAFQYERAIQHALHKNQLIVIQMANRFGVTPAVYEQIVLKAFEAKLTRDLDYNRMEIELERAERMAEIQGKSDEILKKNEADREVKLAFLAAIAEASKRYYDLRGRKASRAEINNAKLHLEDLEKRWENLSKA